MYIIKLRTLPADPAWKLKRELKRNLKKMALAMQTHDDYRHKYGNYNPQTFARPNFKRNIEDGARGWDDLAFYDAFLAFRYIISGKLRNMSRVLLESFSRVGKNLLDRVEMYA